jgi:[ribosomal protein S18]-alanine N-acetyltransferase
MYPKPSLTLRFMRVNDIPQVIQIDRLSFEVPWSEKSYRYEILEAGHSSMVVLEWAQPQRVPRWRQWFGLAPSPQRRLVGYGGMWHITGQAHISTIAVHPRARGRGWGEVLLVGMIQRAVFLQAYAIGLEVRVTNSKAQQLYQKYAFETVGIKPRYYRNNNEDAYEMLLRLDEEAQIERLGERYAVAVNRHGLVDQYTRAVRPSLQRL